MSEEHQRDRDVSQICQKVRSRLPELLDAAPERDEAREVRRHVETCGACAAELEALRGALNLMHDETPPTPSPAIRSQVLAHARGSDAMPQRLGTSGPKRRWQAGMAAAVAASIALGVWMTADTTSTSIPPIDDIGGPPVALAIGDPFPDFVALDVASGDSVSLSDLEGDVVLVNIWATWCGPCESEMPSMERLHRELASAGLTVVAVSVDQESTTKVRQWIDERDVTFTVLHDPEGRFERSFQTVGVPESFVIDRRGVLVAREIGPRMWDSPEYSGIIRDLVEGGED